MKRITGNKSALKKDFIPILTMALVTFFLVASYGSPVWAKHTVLGKITFSNGAPAPGVLVVAMDSDPGGNINKDDKMGQATTNAQGDYSINYAGKHWDAAPHGVTTWCPSGNP